MSLFSKHSAVVYTPDDLSTAKTKASGTQFEKSGHFVDSIDFKIDPQVANQMGLTDAKSKEEKRVFDAEVFKFVQSIKDDAYSEAYKLGREEGIRVAKEEALTVARGEIQEKIKSLISIVQGIDNYRHKMYEANEAEIVRFCYLLAEKIIIKEIKNNKEYVAEIIKNMIPEDESCVVRLNVKGHAFIQTHMNLLSNDLKLQELKIEIDPNLNEGDVVVETKNGILDGTLATRMEKLKNVLEQME